MSGSSLDIAALGHGCVGAMRYKRLQFAAQRAPPQLAAAIYAHLFSEIAREPSPAPFFLATECLPAACDAAAAGPDAAWLARQEKLFAESQRAAEAELAAAKRDGDRDLVFGALYALASLHFDCGDLAGALARYVECKEWCGTGPEMINVSMRIIKCSIIAGSMSHVKTQAMKLRATLEHQSQAAAAAGAGAGAGASGEAGAGASAGVGGVDNAVLFAEIDASVGLVSLRSGSFRAAAQAFLSVGRVLGRHFDDIVSLQDCAIYAAICALATFSRAELRAQLLSSSDWLANIEHTPQWREIVQSYVDSEYQKCFDQILVQCNQSLAFDRLLAAHVEKLLKDIRTRALVQQFQPYAALPLDQLAQQLGMDRAELERSIAESINAGELNARIDTAHALLIKKDHAGHTVSQQKALVLGEQFLRETRNALLRMSLIENGVAINLSKAAARHGER